jgi:hypothetical protein
MDESGKEERAEGNRKTRINPIAQDETAYGRG